MSRVATSNDKEEKTLSGIAKKLNDKYGAGKVVLGSQMQYSTPPRISTGVYALDVETGGGWPRGRLHQLWGPYSSAKSTLAYLTAAEFQKHCHYCSRELKLCNCQASKPIMAALIDVEKTHDSKYAQRLGVDDDLFYVTGSSYGEETIDVMDALIRSGEIGLIIVDSVAALTPREFIEKSASEDKGISPAALARLMSLGTKKWQAGLNSKIPHPVQKIPLDPDNPKKTIQRPWENLCTILLLNQVRSSIGPYPAQPPGGNAMFHALSIDVNLYFTNADIEFSGDEREKAAEKKTIGFVTRKNKTFSEKRSGEFTLNFKETRVENERAVFNYAMRDGFPYSESDPRYIPPLVVKSGSWFEYGGLRVQGEDKAIEAFCHDPKIFGKLKKEMDERVEKFYESFKKLKSKLKNTEKEEK
jgi:RecA/RadA recombinase